MINIEIWGKEIDYNTFIPMSLPVFALEIYMMSDVAHREMIWLSWIDFNSQKN